MSPVKLSEDWREFEPSSDHPAHFKEALIAVKGRDISKVTIYLGRRSRKNHRPTRGSGGDNQKGLVHINARPKGGGVQTGEGVNISSSSVTKLRTDIRYGVQAHRGGGNGRI